MGLKLFERFSPEYALDSAYEDVNAYGLDGLKKHLTENALKTVEGVESISKAPGISQIADALIGGNPVNALLDKLAECKWTTKDVMKGSDTSKAIVAFNYDDIMVGTVELKMIKEEKVWKIDELNTPKFEKFALPQENKDQPAE